MTLLYFVLGFFYQRRTGMRTLREIRYLASSLPPIASAAPSIVDFFV